MRGMSKRAILIAAGCVVLIWCLVSFFSQEEYGIIDLGTLGGDSYAVAVNDIGQVAGHSEIAIGSDDEHAFFWDTTTGMMDLGTLGGRKSRVQDINNLGQVVGSSVTASGEWHAFVWDHVNGMVDLGTVGHESSSAYHVNDDGQVFGTLETNSGDIRIFVWEKDGGFAELRGLDVASDTQYEVTAFNESGEVVGNSFVPQTSSKYVTPYIRRLQKGRPTVPGPAFCWKHGAMIYLETLGSGVSIANDINNVGQIVGFSENEDSPLRHACAWDATGAIKDLGKLGGLSGFGAEYMALSINNKGQIVGWCGYKHYELLGPGWAWYWDSESGMTKLDALVADDSAFERLTGVGDINDRGQIVGYGKIEDDKTRAFLMTPMSECAED